MSLYLFVLSIYLRVVRFMCVNCLFFSLPKCKPNIVCFADISVLDYFTHARQVK